MSVSKVRRVDFGDSGPRRTSNRQPQWVSPAWAGQVSCGGARYIIAVGLEVFSKAAERSAFMPYGGWIHVIYETTQLDDVVQAAKR